MTGTGTGTPGVARAAITLGVLGSLAGNVTWAWPRSPVLVGVGVMMSLVLPVAVRLWRASAGVTGWARTERVAVMGFICAGAALYTLIHSSLLLFDLGLPAVIAWVPGAVMEALVVQAARAGTPPARASRPVTPSRPRRDTPAVTVPAAVPDTAPVGETPMERTRRLNRDRKATQRARQKEVVTA